MRKDEPKRRGDGGCWENATWIEFPKDEEKGGIRRERERERVLGHGSPPFEQQYCILLQGTFTNTFLYEILSSSSSKKRNDGNWRIQRHTHTLSLLDQGVGYRRKKKGTQKKRSMYRFPSSTKTGERDTCHAVRNTTMTDVHLYSQHFPNPRCMMLVMAVVQLMHPSFEYKSRDTPRVYYQPLLPTTTDYHS